MSDQIERVPTILCVDDDPSVIRAMSRLGRGRTDITVETADQPSAALERIKKGGVDGLITDGMMPGMTGIQLAHAVSELRESIFVTLLSGGLSAQRNKDALVTSLRAGEIHRVMLKPPDADEIKMVLEMAKIRAKDPSIVGKLVGLLNVNADRERAILDQIPAEHRHLVGQMRGLSRNDIMELLGETVLPSEQR